MVEEDDPSEGLGIVRVVRVACGDLELQGAAGGNLHPGEVHLHAVHVLCQLFCGEVGVHCHCGEQELLLFCGVGVLVVIHLVYSFFVGNGACHNRASLRRPIPAGCLFPESLVSCCEYMYPYCKK